MLVDLIPWIPEKGLHGSKGTDEMTDQQSEPEDVFSIKSLSAHRSRVSLSVTLPFGVGEDREDEIGSVTFESAPTVSFGFTPEDVGATATAIYPLWHQCHFGLRCRELP